LWPKHAKLGVISDNFRLGPRISPEQMQISKIRKLTNRPRFIPFSAKESMVNFDPLSTHF